MSIWTDAIAQCLESPDTPGELTALLLRIELPADARLAVTDALSMVECLDRSLAIPAIPAGASSRLLNKLRSQPLPPGLESLVSRLASESRPATENSQSLSPESESEREEIRELAAALDSFHRSLPIPREAADRLLGQLATTDLLQDVSASMGGRADAPTDDELPPLIPFPANLFNSFAPPDVLAAQKEAPAPDTSASEPSKGTKNAGGDAQNNQLPED